MKIVKSPKEEDKELDEVSLPERSNVVKLVHGGGDPPSEVWLRDFDVGTVFLSRIKPSLGNMKDFTYGEFCVYNKTEKAILLSLIEGGAPRPLWVDPIRFCNQMDLIEVLRTHAFQEVGEQDDEHQGSV